MYNNQQQEKKNVPLGLSNCIHLQVLYGGHDGNGPFVIAVKNDLVVSSNSNKEGGIHACTIVGKEVDVLNNSSSSSSSSSSNILEIKLMTMEGIPLLKHWISLNFLFLDSNVMPLSFVNTSLYHSIQYNTI